MKALASRAPGLLRRLGRPRTLVPALAALALLAVMVLLRQYLPLWAWLLIIAVVGAGGLTWGLVRAIPWYRQRRFLRAHDGVVAGQETEPARALERRLQGACEVLLQSPALAAGGDPLYRLPWYLVLSPDDATANAFLRPPLAESPFPEPDPVTDLAWSWWFYKGSSASEGLVAIQMPSGFVCEPQQTETRAVWYQALRLLDRQRPKLPLNGIIVLLDAEALAAPGKDLREACTRLRRLVDEALRLLRIEAPVHFVVGGCETLPGFAAFARALPPEARRRVLGQRLYERREPEAALRTWLDQGFTALCRELHGIRLGLMRALDDAATRREVFTFVEAFARLKEGLVQGATVLFEDNPYQRRPWLGGVFFTSAEAFHGDLFGRFLPADQPLARKQRRARVVSWSLAVVAGLLLLAGSAYLAATIFSGSREVAQLIAAAEEACTLDRRDVAAVVPGLVACRERIAALSAARPGFPVDFGLNRAARAEAALEERFVDHFTATVSEPLGQALDQAIAQGRFGFADHIGLARWWALVYGCAEDAGTCATADAAPMFASPAAAELEVAATPDARTRLAALQRTALRWQSPELLEQRRSDLAARLRQAHERRPLSVEGAMDWARGRGSAIGLARFWERQPPSQDAPGVPGAFTHAVWEGGILPLAADLEGSPVAQQAAGFTDAYGRAYADAWRAFLVRFIEGAALWRDDVASLTTRLADTDSPYHRLWQALEEELFPLAGREGLPAWPGALAAAIEELWPAVDPKLRSLYFELAQDPGGRTAYQLAAAIYDPAPDPADPRLESFREVQAALEAPPEDASLSVEGLEAWRVIRQPLELWLRLASRQAGAFLDQQWQAQVVAPSRSVPEAEREAFLFGPQGRVAAFRANWLQPLLGEAGTTPLGVAPPLAGEAMAFFEERTNGGEGTAGPIYAGRLRILGKAGFGALGEGAASFTLDCLNRTQRATSAPGESELTLTWSPTDCFEVEVGVSLPDLLSEVEPDLPAAPLTRTYPGPEGFTTFIDDFRGGPRTMAIRAFAAPGEVRAALLNYGVQSVTVPIELELSEFMERWLARPRQTELPGSIGASPLDALTK